MEVIECVECKYCLKLSHPDGSIFISGLEVECGAVRMKIKVRKNCKSFSSVSELIRELRSRITQPCGIGD